MRTRRMFLVVAISLVGCAQRCGEEPPGVDAGRGLAIKGEPAPENSTVLPPVDETEPLSEPKAELRTRPQPEPLAEPDPPKELWEALPRARVDAGTGPAGPIDPAAEQEWLARLAGGTITMVTPNRGGSTITLRARFTDGSRAVLKPRQRRWQAGHRAEIAAYHLDRVLGFGRVAPAAGRRFDFGALRAHLDTEDADSKWLERFDEHVMPKDGTIEVAVIAWHARPLFSVEPPRTWLDGLKTDAPLNPEIAPRLAEWSDLLVFDALIDNTDRWSGGNVLGLGKAGPLIFLDQAAAFNPWRRELPLEQRFTQLCRFRKQTVDALGNGGDGRAARQLEERLAKDVLAPVLTPELLKLFETRLQAVRSHIDECLERLGPEVVHSFEAPTPAPAPIKSDASSLESSDASP